MVPVGQFLFRFRLVERVAVSDGYTGDQKGGKTEELGNNEPETFLGVDDVPQVERPGHGHHTHQRQPHEHFVGQRLSRGPHGAQQRVFVAAGPAPEQNRVYVDPSHGQEKQQANVHVRHAPTGGDRDNDKRQQQ